MRSHLSVHKLESSLALRDEDGKESPVEVRLCRFIASVPLLGAFVPVRLPLPGGSLVAVNMFPVVDARGRVEEEASFGRLDAPLRVVPVGAPDARFLDKDRTDKKQRKGKKKKGPYVPLLDYVRL
jgi:hypothetical protein